MKVEERPFTIAEAQGAAEAFITAASTFVCPVVEIDGATVGGAAPARWRSACARSTSPTPAKTAI